ncbi:hypothetical protein CG007_02420 [Mesoplasma entomophilum]|uniref:hypothetical protein n=1 Tax=Mesoplasma entomophilum TaxID=2149 RepID=UPI000D035195|nr:hypothetical protein [Mesoplasma entomophilum]AVN60457.1 hypothetical protein CG007_02420 [Mesoplasma entomophilum]
MKKLLLFLSSLSASAITAINIIGCTTNQKNENQNENQNEKPEEVEIALNLDLLNIQTKIIFSSAIEIHEEIIFNELKSLNQDLEIKWNYLSVIKKEKYYLSSIDENIYTGTIELEIIQKNNINKFQQEMYLKTAEVNEQSIIENFKTLNPEVKELKLLCKKENESWIISVIEENENYDGFIILKIYIKKDISDVIQDKTFKSQTINSHEKIVVKLIKTKYPELADIKLKAILFNKNTWSISVDESELIYYGNCLVQLYV